jgi:hypothetical protein
MQHYVIRLIALVILTGLFGLFVPDTSLAATPSSSTQATTFCKNYPTSATSTKISKTQCRRAFLAGYTEGGATLRSVCPATGTNKLTGAKMTSCTNAYNKGEERGEADRAAAQNDANNNTNSCNGKGVKVSKALGAGGCIGGGNQNPIFALVAYGVQFLTGIFGVIVVLVLVIAGLQYVISGDDPEIAKEAKERIKGAITGLVLFIIMFGLIQTILPPDVKIFTSS